MGLFWNWFGGSGRTISVKIGRFSVKIFQSNLFSDTFLQISGGLGHPNFQKYFICTPPNILLHLTENMAIDYASLIKEE